MDLPTPVTYVIQTKTLNGLLMQLKHEKVRIGLEKFVTLEPFMHFEPVHQKRKNSSRRHARILNPLPLPGLEPCLPFVVF
jgi:hypothetical protein